jgi:hypothetical protein
MVLPSMTTGPWMTVQLGVSITACACQSTVTLQSLAMSHEVSESALQLVMPLYSEPKEQLESMKCMIVATRCQAESALHHQAQILFPREYAKAMKN